MKEYKQKIRNTEISFSMVPIPGGEFMMGSPDSEAHRNEDEGPQHKVKIEPFWMGKTEVTWDEFELWSIRLERALPRPDVTIACQLKRNGNMHAAQERRRPITLAMTPRNLVNLHGSRKTARKTANPSITKLAKRSRIPGVCTTCTETSPNGFKTGMSLIFIPSSSPAKRSNFHSAWLTRNIPASHEEELGIEAPLNAAAQPDWLLTQTGNNRTLRIPKVPGI